MKKNFILAFILFFSSIVLRQSLFAQNAQNQIVIPKQVFVGDTGELKITFSVPTDFFIGMKSDSGNQKGQLGNRNAESIELASQNFTRAIDDTEYTIKKITLTKNGKDTSNQYNYVFSIIFTPWKTGEIKIPPYNLGKAFNTAGNFSSVSSDSTNTISPTEDPISTLDRDINFTITPSPITIDSILTQNNIDPNFVPSKGPLLIPGTTYKIYFQIILIIVLLVALIRILIKWQDVNLFLKNVKLRLLYRRNRKSTVRILNKLRTSKNSDRKVSDEIQIIMRNYLQVRFDYPFTKSATNELMKGFDEIYGGLLSDKKMDAVENLTAIFIRTDYVRYGKEGQFDKGEKNHIIDELIKTIEMLESTKDENDDEISDTDIVSEEVLTNDD